MSIRAWEGNWLSDLDKAAALLGFRDLADYSAKKTSDDLLSNGM
jgi:hypothetical protein